ncbi:MULTISPECIES: NAD(P)-dependent oxidoreductase [unclassified Paenibacillus]|uniref:NAD-dependent epimerase/dehydratase family protein n=1 Tax=unclassified Paenibacillus TaxID=185978 RepID=UPI00278924D8|nr:MULTISPECIES: NAD-dependent epimerase/dehydratase family protein [unclassified Paenibacillus]MDQ0899118.1 nucleoside-diphosphate-sugar epimerase [Paenibacillus sp. V4I7]MDQ0914898.1 nucleoside-diphosphate-sugar epimerase [Paenibacillus sp. V4I5]
MNIFVTGGSGFVGKNLIRRLVSEGHNVWGLARSKKSVQLLEELQVQVVHGSLEDIPTWSQALQGIDVVVHCASIIEVWGEWNTFYTLVTKATENLLLAADKQHVGRFIYISSESVMQDRKPLLGVDETTICPKKPNSFYGQSKLLAEKTILAYTGNIHCVILRPTFIYGPGDSFSDMLQNMVASNKFTWVDHGKTLIERVHVDNVVEAIHLALQNGKDKGIYLITDGHAITARQLFTQRAEKMGITLPQKNIPGALASAFAYLTEFIWRLFHIKTAPPLTRFEVAFVSMPRQYRINKAIQELEYQPLKTSDHC